MYVFLWFLNVLSNPIPLPFSLFTFGSLCLSHTLSVSPSLLSWNESISVNIIAKSKAWYNQKKISTARSNITSHSLLPPPRAPILPVAPKNQVLLHPPSLARAHALCCWTPVRRWLPFPLYFLFIPFFFFFTIIRLIIVICPLTVHLFLSICCVLVVFHCSF